MSRGRLDDSGAVAAARRVRLDLAEDEARALHAGLQGALAAGLLAADRVGTGRDVLDRLTLKVPSWLDRAPVGGEAGYLIAAEAVLRALVEAEDRFAAGSASRPAKPTVRATRSPGRSRRMPPA
jgi:hypothetical protein